MKSVFFGTPQISVDFLEQTKKQGFLFDLVVTNPDRKKGRKQILTPTPAKRWAEKNNIKVLTPEKITEDFLKQLSGYDLFFVLAYGKILPQTLLQIPQYGTLNLHPSLLPLYRGPSPIMSAIIDDKKDTGVSLMMLDEKMDHGPIIAQQPISITEWEKNEQMEKYFAEIGATMFTTQLPNIISKTITLTPQKHDDATFCHKFQKQDMELLPPLDSRKNFLKYCAFPKPFFFDKNNKRNIVTQASWKDGRFIIEKIIPEGKKERSY